MKIEDNNKSVRLKHHEFLEPFLEYLLPQCVELKAGEYLVIYRTQDQIPIDEIGQMPREVKNSLRNGILRKFSKEEVDNLKTKQRDKIIGNWGLSCNNSEEAALKGFLYTYESLEKRGATKEDLESYVNERGKHICRYIITSEAGIITAFDDNGHANLYLYEGVSLENLRDRKYDFTIIEYKSNHEDEQ